MKTQFTPIDYDYFDWRGRNYARIIGRDDKGKRLCIIDSCDVFIWAILKDKLSKKKIDALIQKISKIKLDLKGRQTKVEKVELQEKNFLSKKVQALKIFATNYKDLQDIANQLDFEEIDKRRGYDLGFITHYINEKKISPLKTYEIEGEMLNNSEEFGGIDMALEVDFCIKLESSKEIQKEKYIPKTLAFDIETDSLKIGKGEILMVSLADSEGTKKVITWKNEKKKNPDYVITVKDEAELLERFTEEVKKISPDFLVGYFSDGFDLPFLKARAEKLNVKLSLGLDGTQPKFNRGQIPQGKISGIVHVDILRFIQVAYAQYMKSETLSLNEVAKEFLQDEKIDFKFKHSSKIKENEWEKYFQYNLQDSVLTLKLFQKFWPDLSEFSKIVQEPPYEISRAGLSKYTESYILHNLEKFDEIPEKRPGHSEIGERRSSGGVEGAFVLEPQPGLYEKIVMFDFTSMHTSIIITHNLSKSTLLEKKPAPESKEYFESPELTLKKQKTKFYFQKELGFFPELMKEIFNLRKKYKDEYKKNPDQITKARSNAFKVLSASAHGYLGFFGARYYSLEASASVLAFVRKFNKEIISKAEKEGYKVIYGDSVTGDTKVIVKEKDKIYETEIKNLFEKIDQKDISKKEYNFKKNIKVLTLDKKGKSVFKKIKYVMRHKCKKKLYKIKLTEKWGITTTEDHSLMGYQANSFNQTKKAKESPLNRIIEIKPTEIRTKANSLISLKKIPVEKELSKNYSKKTYELLGYFIGDGSFCRNKQHQKYNKDYYIRISTGIDKEEFTQKLIKPLLKEKVISNFWNSKTRKGDITLYGEIVKIISKDFRKENKKIIPEWMFYEKEENIASFLRGYFSADGTISIRNNAPIIRLTTTNQEFVEKTRNLLYRVGISNSIIQETKPNKYKEKISKTFSKHIIIQDKEIFNKKIGFVLQRKNKKARIKTRPNKTKNIKEFEFGLQGVKQIKQTKNKDYVYDLEVEETHTFFANKILVHNTDSIAFLQGDKTKKQIKEFLNKLNDELPGVMHIELEDFYKRGIWVTTRAGITGAKKKYALIDNEDKLKIRGFETVRRDWCQLARKVQNKVLELILENGDEKKALEFIKKTIKEIKNREIKKDQLIIKTQLKKPLDEYKAISPHVVAAQKMQEQKIPIEMGNLIEYYIGDDSPNQNKKKTKLVRDRVKLPDEKAEYDIEYYLEKQLLPAVENILQVFNIKAKELIDGKRQTSLGDF